MTTCGLCGRVGSVGFDRVLVSDFEARPVVLVWCRAVRACRKRRDRRLAGKPEPRQ